MCVAGARLDVMKDGVAELRALFGDHQDTVEGAPRARAAEGLAEERPDVRLLKEVGPVEIEGAFDFFEDRRPKARPVGLLDSCDLGVNFNSHGCCERIPLRSFDAWTRQVGTSSLTSAGRSKS